MENKIESDSLSYLEAFSTHFSSLLLTCYYMTFVTVPLGIVANLISIFIFTRPFLNQKTNTAFLYTILSILYLDKILFQAVFKQWENCFDFSIRMYLNLEIFIENVLVQCLSWNQALISFDRFITLVYSSKADRVMSKKWVLYSIVFGLFSIITCVNSPLIFFPRSNEIIEMVLVKYIKIFIEVFIPYSIVFIVDIVVVVQLRKPRFEMEPITRRERRNKNRNSRSSRFTISTILIDLIYLIFNFPLIIFNEKMLVAFLI